MNTTGWSYSAYSTYETCPRKYRYAYVERLPQPTSPAAERGKKIHAKGEQYLLGGLDTPPAEFGKFSDLMVDLRELGALPEYEIILDSSWASASKENRWLKSVIDAALIYEDNTALIIDYKTGREYPAHATQMQLYSLALRAAHPNIGDIETRLWYLDSGAESKDISTPAEDRRLQAIWTARANRMLSDSELKTSPGTHCNWCPFHTRKGGPCAGGR